MRISTRRRNKLSAVADRIGFEKRKVLGEQAVQWLMKSQRSAMDLRTQLAEGDRRRRRDVGPEHAEVGRAVGGREDKIEVAKGLRGGDGGRLAAVARACADAGRDVVCDARRRVRRRQNGAASADGAAENVEEEFGVVVVVACCCVARVQASDEIAHCLGALVAVARVEG